MGTRKEKALKSKIFLMMIGLTATTATGCAATLDVTKADTSSKLADDNGIVYKLPVPKILVKTKLAESDAERAEITAELVLVPSDERAYAVRLERGHSRPIPRRLH